jgi:polyisoprenyl-phosphate glycosyltransferase
MISIIIPVYNNSSTLHELAMRITLTLKNEKYEIIFINDGSVDDSREILKGIVKEFRQVRVISFSRNFGQHPAISAGFERARGDKIILMDADLQDRPENIPLLIDNLKGNIDIVYTIRHDKQKMFFRDMTSNFFHYLMAKQIRTKMPRNIGTFSLFSRKVLEAILQYKEVNILFGPLLYSVGFQYCCVPIERDQRLNSKSSYSFIKRLELGVNSIISYTDLPYKIFSCIGIIFLFGSLIYTILILLQYLFFGRILPDGTTIIILLILITIGSIISCLGILGIYLVRVFQEVLHRPRYLIDEIIENE